MSLCALTGTFNASLSCNSIGGGTSFTWNIYDANSTLVFTDNNPFNNPINLTFPNTGTYIVKCIYYINGLPISTAQTINVTAPPTPTITLTPAFTAPLCIGACLTYTANGALTYTWSTGVTTPTATFCPTVTTTYTVKGTNACGIVGTKTFVVSVYLPQGPISALANPNPICLGSSSSLQASGANSYTFTGLGAANNISVTPTVTTTYTVFGSNGICANTQSAVVTVTVLSSVQPTVSISQSVPYPCIGSSITLTANVTPVGTYTYNWSAPINQTGQVVTFMPTENANYICTVTGACGSVGNNKTCISVVSNKCCIPGGEVLNNVTLTGANFGSNLTGITVKVFGTVTITGNITWTNDRFKDQQEMYDAHFPPFLRPDCRG